MSDNKLVNINTIFSNKFFKIPDYQRGYSWELAHLEDLWEDINILLNKDESIHYSGVITVEKIRPKYFQDSANSTYKPFMEQGQIGYFVVDGQQRLTTLLLLIKAILNMVPDDAKILHKDKNSWEQLYLYEQFEGFNAYKFAYNDLTADEVFKTKILKHQSAIVGNLPEESLYSKNLVNAYDYFVQKLVTFKEDELQALFKIVVNSLRFNFYEIDDELDVFVTFETMNNRGKKLSKLELLKNRLIYLSTLINFKNQESANQLRKTINECWRTIYTYLGKESAISLEDDDFLKDHWIMFFPGYNRKEADVFSKFLLNEHFTYSNFNKNNISADSIREYAISLQASIKQWYLMQNPHCIEGICSKSLTLLERLNRLRFRAFKPLIMGALIKEGANSNNFLQLVESCEKFIFLISRISRRKSNAGDSFFYDKAHEYFSNKETISEICNTIQNKTNDWFSLENFHSHILDNFKHSNGYYSWDGLRYLLFEYECSLQPQGGDTKITWNEFYYRRELNETIEHIYPQNPENEYWEFQFKGIDVEECKKYCNSLGNLLLLSRKKNSEQGRRDFKSKVCRKNSNGEFIGYHNGSYSEIEVGHNPDWEPADIYNRGIKILQFIEKHWEVTIDNKDKYLGISNPTGSCNEA